MSLLNEFDMKKVGNAIALVIGKSGTGKSTLIVDYLYNHRDIPFCTAISPSDEFHPIYRSHMPESMVHETYSPKLVENFLTRQKKITLEFKQCVYPEFYPTIPDPVRIFPTQAPDPRGVLIMDDCLTDSNFIEDPSLQWIFMTGGRVNISCLITVQYAMNIPPTLRVNVDYVFIFREPNLSHRKMIYRAYAGVFPTFELFDQVLTSVTDDYGCLVIDNTSLSAKLEDQVFWYKAKLHKDFRMGCVSSDEESSSDTE
jgi:hypothetical protein